MTTILERDTGFCSGGDDDEGFYSHTDASDDSGDVKVRGASQLRNKRKCSEPRRLDTDLPAKKRKLDSRLAKTGPFRPWSEASPPRPSSPTTTPVCPPTPQPWTNHRPLSGEKPYALTVPVPQLLIPSHPFIPAPSRTPVHQDEPLSLVSKKKESRRPASNAAGDSKDGQHELTSNHSDAMFQMDSILSLVQESCSGQPGPSGSPKGKSSQQIAQRNYKNMTRERRIEANARERTRVHTISAAFDTLRSSIPAYSHNQKLSKLSVLRIACSYIVSLSRLTGEDYSVDESSPSLAECVSSVSRTIQTEGKVRKKKDE